MYGDTHIGLVRSKNEDRYLMKKINDDAVIFAVADGMGGEPAGDIAADVMISKLSDMEPDSGSILSLLCRCIEDANQAIIDKVGLNPHLMGMGTTVTCALVKIKLSIGRMWETAGCIILKTADCFRSLKIRICFSFF